ncbi:MAG TPA: kelch repeat-containing protein, partial [Polyangiaceae bacterium]|nr:kelch repeat-containing protein [Polyangiaceae bacterium]
SGGTYFNDGSRFDPATNSWQPMTAANAPTARVNHTAVWTGNRMIVWGGSNSDGDQLADGGRYDPVADSWEPMAAAPTAREIHSAVWNDVIDAMWIYGGFGDVSGNPNIYLPGAGEPGGRSYDPGADAWDTLQVTGEPSARALHSAVFDGTRMIVYGGTDGTDELSSGHKLEGNSWSALMGPAPSARRDHTAAWIVDAGKMVVFGGRRMGVLLGDGAVYDSASGGWSGVVPSAIEPRIFHTAVSTGSRMLVWGGFGPAGALQTGGVFRP